MNVLDSARPKSPMTERFDSGVIQKFVAGALLHLGRNDPACLRINVHQNDAVTRRMSPS
jgi:hypothetical protein